MSLTSGVVLPGLTYLVWLNVVKLHATQPSFCGSENRNASDAVVTVGVGVNVGVDVDVSV